MDDNSPVVRVDELVRWNCTFVPAYNQMEEIAIKRSSPFPFNQDINSKIAYWNGDITLLNAHAIVCCNNESLTDTDAVTSATILKAGKELRDEMMNEIKTCRTGEAKISKGYCLPARHVIHTVGPRYNIKYKTAAENALFNSYRNTLLLLWERNLSTLGLRCIHTNRRAYPSLEGAHRTVRRFLEKFGEKIDLIVFVVMGLDRESYNSLLPIYFPRNTSEELYAVQRLPVDIGNEDGEPVIAERKIRISANPSKETSGNPTAPVVTVLIGLCLTNSSGKDDDEVDDDFDDGPNEEEIREVLGTNLSIGEHAFSKMEANADKERMTRSKALAVSPSEEERKAMKSMILEAIVVDFLALTGFLYL